MKGLLIALATVFVGCCHMAMSESTGTIEQAAHRIIIQLKPGTTSAPKHSITEETASSLGDQLGLQRGTRIFESGFTQWRRSQIRQRGGNDVRELGSLASNHRLIIQCNSEAERDATLARLKSHPRVLIAEADHMGMGGGLIPTDPNYVQQWHHTTIDSSNAWARTIGSTSIFVAVLDTGIRSNLNEFAGRLIDGYDFANNDADPYDDYGHGTSVSGVLAANGSNGILVAGMDWRCKIMPVKVLDSSNLGLYSWWADGIDWAVSNGAKVINLSAGGSLTSSALEQAISNAIDQGVIFVTISQNDGGGTITFPGNLDACITVGSTSNNDVRAPFSNFGTALDLVAPGTVVATVSSNGALQYWSGTSFSAPLVAGICSLMASINPDINQHSAIALLKGGAEDRVGDAQDTPGFDVYYGYGRVNADYTLWLAQSAFMLVDNPTNGSIRLRWSCPPSASNQTPFGIEFANSTTSEWSRITLPSNVVYSSTYAEWIDNGTQSGSEPGQQRFYRHIVR